MFVFSCVENGTESVIVKIPKPVKQDFSEIFKRKKIVALVENTSTTHFIYKGQSMGFEYDLLYAFAKSNKLDLEIVSLENLDSMIYYLNSGKVDIIASNLAVTPSRKKRIKFSIPVLESNQVLVQPKSNDTLINALSLLDGKRIWVHKSSAFYDNLVNLKSEANIDINIQQAPVFKTTESLIKQVAEGEISYTVSDKITAELNSAFYKNIDISFQLGSKETMAWAVRRNAPELLLAINEFLESNKKLRKNLYNKYFKASKYQMMKPFSPFASTGGKSISEYDEIFMSVAKVYNIDWRLLAADAFKESRFDNNAKSWAGAFGIMQLMPETALEFGLDTNATAIENINAGAQYLRRLANFWESRIEDSNERKKFILASYNVGLGHVLDARKIASINGKDTNIWRNNVEWGLAQKTNPEVYLSKEVKFGYCRASEPIKYVKDVMQTYKHFIELEN